MKVRFKPNVVSAYGPIKEATVDYVKDDWVYFKELTPTGKPFSTPLRELKNLVI